MNFHIARAAATTGNLLQQLVLDGLREQQIAVPRNVEICYGVGYQGPNKVLNASCSRMNKLQQGQRLHERLGINALMVLTRPEEVEEHIRRHHIPFFAREVSHTKGRDIKLVLEDWQVRPLMRNGTGFFTPHISSVKEFRTWGYRNRHLGSYEKVLTRPGDFKKVGRNYANGFDFNGIENDQVPQGLKDVCRNALAALDLDFGAVDALQKADGTFVVLEVNSAPGVAHERRRVITGLAHRIIRWVSNGCPDRRGE